MSRLPLFNFIPGPPPGPPPPFVFGSPPSFPSPPSSPFVFGSPPSSPLPFVFGSPPSSPSPFVFGSPPSSPPPLFLETHFSDFELMDEGKLMDVFQISEIDNNLLDIIDPALFTTQAERDSIELFVKTYSAYHIRNFTQAQKESLKQRLWHNQVLITLITNLDKPKLYAVNYLEGPVSFKLFQFNNKTVYLFGEMHKNTQGQCWLDSKPFPPVGSIRNSSPTDTLRLNQFIELLSYDTPSFFDFYIETGIDDFYTNSTNILNTSWIFTYIFYLLYDYTQIFTETSFVDSSDGLHIISNMNRIANDFVNRNNLLSLASTGIIPDQELLDDIYSYYMSNRNIYSHATKFTNFEMFDTKSKFIDCFRSDVRKNKAECRLGRFHNVDARRILGTNKSDILEPLQLFAVIVGNNLMDPNLGNGYGWFFLLRNSGIEAFLQKILEPSTGTSDENMFNHILDMYPMVKKEWERSYYKQKIKDFFKNKIKNIDISMLRGGSSNLDILANYSLTMFRDSKATTTNSVVYINHMNNIIISFFRIANFIMDIYCLSRVFKKFKIKTDCQPVETNNIIIYAGDTHSRVYSEFILSLGNIPVYQTNNPNYSCVELGFNSASNPIANLNI